MFVPFSEVAQINKFLLLHTRLVRSYTALMQNETNKPILFIRELCKHKTEAEILEAEENFRRYLMLVKRICEREEAEEDAAQSIDTSDNYEIV